MKSIKLLFVLFFAILGLFVNSYAERPEPGQNCISLNTIPVMADMYDITYERYLGHSISASVNGYFSPSLFWSSGMYLGGGALSLKWYFLDTGMKYLYLEGKGGCAFMWGGTDLGYFGVQNTRVDYGGNIYPVFINLGFKWVGEEDLGITIEPSIGLEYEFGDGLRVKYTDKNGNVSFTPPESSSLQLVSSYYFFWNKLVIAIKAGWQF